MNQRLESRSLMLAAAFAAAALLGCSGKKGPTAAPPPPDDPTPPVLQFVANFQPGSQSVSLTPPAEDLNLEVVTIQFQHSGAGGITVSTNFVPGFVPKNNTLTASVTTPWTWESTDYYTLGVRVRRPGQTRTFGLCCLGCSHTGGTLQNGPCSR